MIIYIVVRGENHEGSSVIGVFSTKEKAEKLQVTESKSICSVEYVDIIEWELDGKEVIEPSILEAGLRQIELNRAFLQMSKKLFEKYVADNK